MLLVSSATCFAFTDDFSNDFSSGSPKGDILEALSALLSCGSALGLAVICAQFSIKKNKLVALLSLIATTAVIFIATCVGDATLMEMHLVLLIIAALFAFAFRGLDRAYGPPYAC